MAYFDKDIFEGLETFPTPNVPGTLIVTADAQSIYSGPNAGDSILAGFKYGIKNTYRDPILVPTFESTLQMKYLP